jgi:hypothetical protein
MRSSYICMYLVYQLNILTLVAVCLIIDTQKCVEQGGGVIWCSLYSSRFEFINHHQRGKELFNALYIHGGGGGNNPHGWSRHPPTYRKIKRFFFFLSISFYFSDVEKSHEEYRKGFFLSFSLADVSLVVLYMEWSINEVYITLFSSFFF